MAAGVAHELGTPLNVISGRARMIARKGSPDIVQNATIIDGQAQRMTADHPPVADFRPYSQEGATRPPEIAQKTLDMLRPFAKRHAVDLRLECTDNLARVDADAGQLEQVLTNLVMNAIQAMPQGGEINVSIDDVDATPPQEHGGSSGRYQRLAVRDQGTGIPRRDLDRIFEPFFTTRDVGEGTGLGLSVTHGIVRDHGGWLAVESEINKGSRFSVYLRHEVTN
jgi:signal transduction histidine kinase